jgi:hypothetical protein
MAAVHGWSNAACEAEVESTQAALEQRQSWRATAAGP